jgi:SAM-dependent methyltransferase
LLDGFAKPGFSCLEDVETECLRTIGVEGKAVGQICCNNGRELLSIKNLGAATCVGFDQSSAFLAQGAELAASGSLDCRFVETDIYQISEDFDASFDVLVITIGVFGWMPDLGGFFDVVNRLLRPGGHLFVHEQHPINNMLEPGDPDPHRLVNSYFRAEPFVETDAIVYEDESEAGEGETHYWFVHTLADVITACLERGLNLVHFAESAVNISSEAYDIYQNQPAQLPMSYSLVARKDARSES